MSDNNKIAIITEINNNPDDMWAWLNLYDILAAEDAHPEVLAVCRNHGTWCGVFYRWQEVGHIVVDQVPLFHVRLLDKAPVRLSGDSTYAWNTSLRDDFPERVPSELNLLQSANFATAEEAQTELTRALLVHARRRKDKNHQPEVTPQVPQEPPENTCGWCNGSGLVQGKDSDDVYDCVACLPTRLLRSSK